MEKSEGLLVVAFFIGILRNTIYQLFLWQLKEYRLDRFLVHLKTWQGKQLLFGKTASIKWLLLLAAPFFFFIFPHLLTLIVLTFFTFEALIYIRQFLSCGWRIPIFTFKTIFIGVLVFLSISAGLIFLPLPLGFKVLLFDRALLFLVGLAIVLTNIPARIYYRVIILKAKEKIKKQPRLLTIGITGSYGKSTTKEFLAQILSKKYNVLKTPANINTDIGIAKTILKNLKKEHRFFVCEMGAYKKGEIKAICNIVNPQIGIITGLNEQHLSLFGSLEQTIAAKFELIEALSPKSLAVFNGENEHCFMMADKAKAMGREVKIVKKDKTSFKANLPSEFFLTNFLMAKTVAEKLGMKSEKIIKAAKKLKLPSHTMQILKKNGLTLIDDTYNSNPQGALAALDYLKNFKEKKYFVFQPMIELGQASGRLHEEMGRKAVGVCDQIILTNRNYYQDFIKGAKDKASLKKELPRIQKGAILFEGREARKLMESLITNKPELRNSLSYVQHLLSFLRKQESI